MLVRKKKGHGTINYPDKKEGNSWNEFRTNLTKYYKKYLADPNEADTRAK